MQKDNHISPLVSVITVNYNNAAVTTALLASIRQHQYPRLEVIVVDNASQEDGSADFVAAYPEVKIVKSPVNRGFAGGNNLGIEAAAGEYFFLVNNDTEFTPGLVSSLLDIFSQYPDAGIVSPKFHYYFHPGIIEYAGYKKVDVLTGRNAMIGCKEKDEGQYNVFSATAYAHGGAMMMKRSVVAQVGLMPEIYFLYYEEFDWCAQFKQKGYQIYYQPEALIYHKESMTTGKNSPLKTYYLTRNRILFMRRNVRWYQLWLFLLFFTVFTVPKHTLSFLLKREKAHLKAFWNGIAWHLNNLYLKSETCAA
ncbi:glycosyltransferase family 2 protein [Chitinophaga vietnamensis]|uniref:glycosyltransferase family 2 protein n=1 Tax=Chitinophaga vietnamensis TaxID=2593957 RepID=UPI001177A01E|nr:glycosyltransferase family 2 protein [Chitinophaga vietnamensis]